MMHALSDRTLKKLRQIHAMAAEDKPASYRRLPPWLRCSRYRQVLR